jgi:hypothetical protein
MECEKSMVDLLFGCPDQMKWLLRDVMIYVKPSDALGGPNTFVPWLGWYHFENGTYRLGENGVFVCYTKWYGYLSDVVFFSLPCMDFLLSGISLKAN